MPDVRSTFRKDINALRALSVVAVVGFHLKIPGFAGGFAGVDIFLVITGYLMTMKIVADLTGGRFSLSHFWMMRMRRIYPALAVVVVACIVTGWFVTMPDQYLKHLLQALSALTFLSNFAFGDANGYFALAAHTKPLLHTWSLSIEWQFYFWMPVGVWLVWSRSSDKVRAVQIAFVAVAAVSLAWCLWQSHTDSTASSFFSLRARAWEPLAGGLIALAEARRKIDGSTFWAQLSTVSGWLLLIGCVAYPLPESNWPSLVTVLPVIGAVLVISLRQPVSDGSLLASPIVQRLGDWSYSIYLWHWPVWVFAIGWLSLHGYPVQIEHKAALMAVSITLGAASYFWIEQPVRLRKGVWTPRVMIRSSVGLIAACGALVGLAFLNDGFPSRLPDYLRPAELARRMNTPRDECFRNSHSEKSEKETYCSFGRKTATPVMMLWGDSFANQYLEPLSAVAFDRGIHGLIATQSGCRAFIDDPIVHAADTTACRSFNRETLSFLLSGHSPETVVLGSNWVNATEIAHVVDRLLTADKTVVLIMPLLNIGFDVPQQWIENQVRAGHAIPEWSVRADPSLTQQHFRAEIRQSILQKHSGNPRLIIADPQQVICGDGECWLVRDGQANFRDSAHISNVTAIQFKKMFDDALGAISPPIASAGAE